MEDALSPAELVLMERALRSRDGIFVAEITRSMGISVKDAAAAFKKLRSRGFLAAKGSTLVLTSKGRGWIMANQQSFAFTGEKPGDLHHLAFNQADLIPSSPTHPGCRSYRRASLALDKKLMNDILQGKWSSLAYRSVIASADEVHDNLSTSRFFESLKKSRDVGVSSDRQPCRSSKSLFLSKNKDSTLHMVKRCLHRKELVAAAI